MLETGDSTLAVRELDRVFEVLQVSEADRDRWRRLAEGARARCWWDAFSDDELSEGARTWAGYEWGARRLRGSSGNVIPGLLQTDAYTTALLRANVHPPSPEETRRFLDVKAKRRSVLDEPDPLDYHVVFEEAAVRRYAGPGVMADQVAHVLDVIATHPNVTVQVVPFSAGLYPAMNGGFTLLDFGIEGDNGLLALEPGLRGAAYSEQFAQIAAYSAAFEKIVAQGGASADETLDTLHQVQQALEE